MALLQAVAEHGRTDRWMDSSDINATCGPQLTSHVQFNSVKLVSWDQLWHYQKIICFILKGTLSCLEKFIYIVVLALDIWNLYFLFPKTVIYSFKFWKNLKFLVRKVTIFASMAPMLSQFWCQRLQCIHYFGVNGCIFIVTEINYCSEWFINYYLIG